MLLRKETMFRKVQWWDLHILGRDWELWSWRDFKICRHKGGEWKNFSEGKITKDIKGVFFIGPPKMFKYGTGPSPPVLKWSPPNTECDQVF